MDLELLKTKERFNKQQERLDDDFGHSASVEGQVIIKDYIGPLIERIPEFLKTYEVNAEADFLKLISNIPHETIALCILTGALNSLAYSQHSFRSTTIRIGSYLESEVFAHGLKEFDKNLAKRLERLAKSRHGSLKYRKQAVRSLAKKNNYQVDYWTQAQRAVAGAWCVNVVCAALPEVFTLERDDRNDHKALVLRQEAHEYCDQIIRQALYAYPVFLPTASKPIPWTDWAKGGPIDSRLSHKATLLRSVHSETAAHVRGAIADGTMKPAVDALNRIQKVAWRINEPVLDIIKWASSNNVSISSLPPAKDLEPPKHPKPWDDMTARERKLWRIEANKVKKNNRTYVANRVLRDEDLTTADYILSKGGVFYTPCNMDWRGRVYPLPHFNYQRNDMVRSLFLFDQGQKITPEAIDWIKVHLANVGDFKLKDGTKTSKISFEDRIAWVDQRLEEIRLVSEDPRENRWWQNADKPFQFLAACIELISAIENPEHMTHLPIAFDGSCSGLQHLSAMTQAAEGALVNLTHTDKPHDIYSTVSTRVTQNLEALRDSMDTDLKDRYLANLCLEYGITRKVCKRATMTYGYSSQKYGMAVQLRTDLMEPLSEDVLRGKLEKHPFGTDDGWRASRFLASHIFDTIEEIVQKPAEAMAFLRQLARALAHENKVAHWITPVGVPWINRYHRYNVKRVVLWLMDKGVKIKHRMNVADSWERKVHKQKTANGIAPNFVHALDAAHLMMTVNALHDEGIEDVALVHDSFGVHATHAEALGRILREEFIRLYTENDPLNDILESAMDHMTKPERLPLPIKKGPLDINEVRHARYAFS